MIALQTRDLNKNIDVIIRKAIEGENVLLTNELNEGCRIMHICFTNTQSAED